MRWTEQVKRMEIMRNSFKISVGKREGNTPLEDLDVGLH